MREAARASEITEGTLKKAKGALGVIARKRGFQRDSQWVWTLPGGTGDNTPPIERPP